MIADDTHVSGRTDAFVRDSMAMAFPSLVPLEKRFVLTFEAYFDESGTDLGSDTVCVAGYIATVANWAAFNQAWRAALREWGLEFFHHKPFLDGQGLYREWPGVRRDALFVRLAQIINRHVFGSTTVRIRRHAYGAILSREAQKALGIYGLAAMRCFMNFAAAKEHAAPDARIRYIYAQGAPGADQIRKGFDLLWSNEGVRNQLRLLAISFEDVKMFTPLQAADILATERFLDRHRSQSQITSPPGLFLGLLEPGKRMHFCMDLSDDYLRTLNQEVLHILLQARRERAKRKRAKQVAARQGV